MTIEDVVVKELTIPPTESPLKGFGTIILCGLFEVKFVIWAKKDGSGYFQTWPKRESINKKTGEKSYEDVFKVPDPDTANLISEVILQAFSDLQNQTPEVEEPVVAKPVKPQPTMINNQNKPRTFTTIPKKG